MSVVAEIAIFPLDLGEHLSPYVALAVKAIRESGFPCVLGPMGTSYETPTVEEAFAVASRAYSALAPHSQRVYCTIKLDIAKDRSGRLEGKVASVQEKIG